MSLLGSLLGGGGGITVKEVTKIKSIGTIDNVNIQSFPCPKVDDKGLTGAWWWADKIALAVTLWATVEAWKAAKEEYNIGKSYYDLAREQWDFFYDFYRPLEDQEMAEIWAEKPYDPDYVTAIKGHTHLIDNVFNNADRHRKSLADKYCVCKDVSQFTKTDIMKSTVYGDSDNFARRYAEKLAQEKNDMRWDRRVVAANRGRGLLANSMKFADKAAGFFSDYAQAMGGLASNAEQFRGYIRNRNETVYNGARERVNGRATVANLDYHQNGSQSEAYYRNLQITNTADTGGATWGNNYNVAPYMQSGLDPTGVTQIQTVR